ncbi:MAG: hypothetical protein GY761_09775 [Hyphomicrobiales bacterium]|nr:hypothetical protein [Hyphomicrobiales bacterium]
MIYSPKSGITFAIIFILVSLFISGSVWGQTMIPQSHRMEWRQLNLSQDTGKDEEHNIQLALMQKSDVVGQIKSIPVVPATSFYAEPNVVILSVRCIRPTTGSDEDLIYLSVENENGDLINKSRKRRMKAGDSWDPKFGVRVSKTSYLALMEDDTFSSDDLIGYFKYQKSRRAGQYVETMKGDGGEYEVVIEVKPFSDMRPDEKAILDKIEQDQLTRDQRMSAQLEEQLERCVRKFSAKYPGTDVVKSWCKHLYFAVRIDKLKQCRRDNNLLGSANNGLIRAHCGKYMD